MSNKRVVVIRNDTLDRSTRATKVINALTKAGYTVTFLCWNRGFKAPRSERQEAGIFHKEIQLRLKAPWGNKAFFFIPIWWSFIFIQLMVIKWDIAHAAESISIIPTIIAGKLRRKPVIYELLDVYEDSISLPKIIRDACVKIDKLFMRAANGIILADEAQIEGLGGIPNPNVVAIYDSPSTVSRIDFSPQKNSVFTLFYAGLLYSGKALNLDKIFRAVNNIDNVKVIIAGYGDLVDEIISWSNKMPNKIAFIGEISRSEVLERSSKADLLFILRDTTIPVNRYICGSKILEAMRCGKPILVNSGTSTSEIVLKEKCGLAVDARDIKQIENAIIKLRDDPDLCIKLGNNARNAYLYRYSWEIMKERLLKLYADLIPNYSHSHKLL
jgi:glycosyltransferase involved in cell wall biosynthesis